MKTAYLFIIGIIALGLIFGCTQPQTGGTTKTDTNKATTQSGSATGAPGDAAGAVSQSVDNTVIANDVNIGDVLP